MANIEKELPSDCPACGGRINVRTMANTNESMASWMCNKCRAMGKGYEHPEIRRGRRLAKEFKGVFAMDKRITRMPCNVQIGILRERHRLELEREENNG